MAPRRRARDTQNISITGRPIMFPDDRHPGQPLGGGVELVVDATFDIDDPELSYLVALQVVAHEGRLACKTLTVSQRDGGPPVTGQGLRAVTIETYLTEIRRGLIHTGGGVVILKKAE
jgi:hypothetical protein